MADETKPEGQENQAPAGAENQNPEPANQGPSAEELRKQNEELQKQIKDRDAKLADLETTQATIVARQRQVEEERLKQTTDASLRDRIKQINERRAYDPDGADAEMATLLADQRKQAADDAVRQATATISQQTMLDRLRSGIKMTNSDFDDELVDDVMMKANMLASTGKYRTAEEAVTAATAYVKSKLDGYAKKKNAAPPLPPGAGAERGGNNTPPLPPEPPKDKSPLEELEEANATKSKRLL